MHGLMTYGTPVTAVSENGTAANSSDLVLAIGPDGGILPAAVVDIDISYFENYWNRDASVIPEEAFSISFLPNNCIEIPYVTELTSLNFTKRTNIQ